MINEVLKLYKENKDELNEEELNLIEKELDDISDLINHNSNTLEKVDELEKKFIDLYDNVNLYKVDLSNEISDRNVEIKRKLDEITSKNSEMYKLLMKSIDSIDDKIKKVKTIKGEKGEPGKSIKGEKGDKGDIPRHKWEGTKLAFELPGNKWGKAVDLVGKDGQSVMGNFPVTPNSGSFLNLTDVPASYTGQTGKALLVNTDESGVEFGTINTADEKVKYDAADPTAGYLSDKVAAGPGITLSEGTGTDENKVKITNTSLAGVGGYSAPLYFTTDASDVAGYYKISYNNQPTEVELSGVVNNEEKLLRTYLYDDIINTTVIDAGIWASIFRVKVSNATQETTLKFEAFLRHADDTETTLFSAYSDEINNTDYANLEKNTPQPVFACVATDRLGVRIYAKTTSQSSITVLTIVGDGNASWFTAPLALRHNLLRAMQGGTTDEYYHLTAAEHTASTQLATNIQNGLLSSSDWTTFNSKAPTNNPIFTGSITTPIIKPASDSTTAIQITKANGTTNVLDIDTTNVRVGIGTTAPLRKLHVSGDAFLIERKANDPAIIWRNTLDSTYPTQEWILGARVTVSGHLNSLLYSYRDDTNGTSTVIMALTKDGKIGLGTLTPTARLQLPAGTATANTAPLKLTSGVLNTVSEAGTMEFNTDDLYFTTTTGAGVGTTYAKYPPVQSSTYVTSTTRYSTSYYAYFTTNPARSLTGSYTGNQWISSTGSTTNQRFHIDLGSAQTITRIYYENSHNSGTVTNTGVKNFTLWGSNTASDFSDLVYANDGTWVQLPTEVTQFEEHVASDTTDPKYIEVTNTTAYRYYAFKFADNWGATTFMGARRIELWNTSTLDGRRNIITSNDGKLTAGRIPYATTNGRLKDSKKLTFDGLTLTVPSVRVAYVAKTADYTLTASDYTVECTANTFTISLPTAVGITGRIYNIKNTGTGTITVDANDSETIDGELTQTVAQWENLQIQSNGTNWIIL